MTPFLSLLIVTGASAVLDPCVSLTACPAAPFCSLDLSQV